MHRFPVAAAGLLVVATAACGGGGTPTGSPTSAAITLVFAPDPVRAGACPPSHCGPLLGEMEALGTVTVCETAGVAATVQSVAMEMRFANTTVGRGELDAAAVTQQAGSNRVAAAGTLAVPVGMHFTPAAGQLPATWVLTVTVQDERGNRVSSTVSVAVQ